MDACLSYADGKARGMSMKFETDHAPRVQVSVSYLIGSSTDSDRSTVPSTTGALFSEFSGRECGAFSPRLCENWLNFEATD